MRRCGQLTSPVTQEIGVTFGLLYVIFRLDLKDEMTYVKVAGVKSGHTYINSVSFDSRMQASIHP